MGSSPLSAPPVPCKTAFHPLYAREIDIPPTMKTQSLPDVVVKQEELQLESAAFVSNGHELLSKSKFIEATPALRFSDFIAVICSLEWSMWRVASCNFQAAFRCSWSHFRPQLRRGARTGLNHCIGSDAVILAPEGSTHRGCRGTGRLGGGVARQRYDKSFFHGSLAPASSKVDFGPWELLDTRGHGKTSAQLGVGSHLHRTDFELFGVGHRVQRSDSTSVPAHPSWILSAATALESATTRRSFVLAARSLDNGHSAIHSPYKGPPVMISPDVMQELLAVHRVLHYLPESQSTEKGWTPNEQQLFWVALTTYPQGPWTAIADYIGTKTTRQAMTHAQKLRQKLKRWNTRLRSNPAVSSLMDSVTVTSDGDVTVSASAPHDISPISVSFPVSPASSQMRDSEHESKHQVVSYTAATGAVGYRFHAPMSSSQSHGRALPSHYQVPFMLGLREHTQAATIGLATPSETTAIEAVHTSIPHDFLDELVNSLSKEDPDDEEITEEELQELDDGDLAK
ncbi:unnamed protein product [Phytophthora fragariaefolia]|uniref:Unnamed protein product n=1 Tax=Phytophthora fragariaefolia TaxID=1490495 RepID=A0A9W6X748_9STRA|nr:unnamed protein product [Phytophthora fragariaefolia]